MLHYTLTFHIDSRSVDGSKLLGYIVFLGYVLSFVYFFFFLDQCFLKTLKTR